MRHAAEWGLNRTPITGLVRYARTFYELLSNRRKFERVPVSDAVVVVCKGIAVGTTHTCSCVNRSPRGIALDCPEPLEVDELVQLHADDHITSRGARVRHCRQSDGGYRVGLEFVTKP
jgi:hypothetical protein